MKTPSAVGTHLLYDLSDCVYCMHIEKRVSVYTIPISMHSISVFMPNALVHILMDFSLLWMYSTFYLLPRFIICRDWFAKFFEHANKGFAGYDR